MKTPSTSIFVKTNFEAFHYWSQAPVEVAFLRNEHRHIFYVEVTFKVNHNDRELEFFILKRRIDAFIFTAFKGKRFPFSCEELATQIGTYLIQFEELPVIKVEVSEDLENGTIVEF